MFTQIRPVGNAIKLKAKEFDTSLFSPFIFSGYQSGTAALAATLICAKGQAAHIINPEVLLPAYACPDLISACLFAKVKPILVDFEENRPWMSLQDINNKVNNNTIAIIAINFLGIPERIEKIRNITQNNNLLIIEDSAQGVARDSLDSYWKGDLIITSFGRGKPLSLFGGGAVFYKDKIHSKFLPQGSTNETSQINSLIYQFKVSLVNFLSMPFLYFILNRLPFINLGETVFKPLEKIESLANTIRSYLTYARENYCLVNQLNHELSAMLESINSDAITDLPKACNLNLDFPLLRYPILITDMAIKNKIATQLEKQGLGISYMYKQPLNKINSIPKKAGLDKQVNPIADNFSQQLITLPTHSGINIKVINKIKRCIQLALD